uniref:Uncharacterized protein n=1 Tax=Lactuca sativa TaxID=4236 RepID=A0A9R1WMU6_LACSA|nr:hypothetical protein LSAT_V11C100032930 [Lactuca sativa]
MMNAVAELVFIPSTELGDIMLTVEVAKLLLNRDQRLSKTILKATEEWIHFIELPQDETPPNVDVIAPMTLLNDFINTHCKYVKSLVGDMMKRPRSTRVIAFVNNMWPVSLIFHSTYTSLRILILLGLICISRNYDVAEFTNSDTRMLSSCLRTLSNRCQPKSFLLCTTTKKGWPFFVIMYGN